MKSHETDIARSEGLPIAGLKRPAKSTGNSQATAEHAGGACAESMPSMGTTDSNLKPLVSEVGYPMRATPKPEKVRDVVMNPAAKKKAHAYNERSQNGGANPSAYPDGE